MTTAITGSSTAPVQTTSTNEITAAATAPQTQRASSLDDTVSALATSLSGFTSQYMHQPQSHPRVFARMERLVDAISRLIDAIANYRSSTKTEPTVTADQAPAAEQTAPKIETAAPVTSPSVEDGPITMPAVIDDPTPAPEQSAPVDSSSETPVIEQEAAPAAPPALELGAQLPPTGGFLWKPTSDKNGDLVILLPKQYTGKVKQVRVLNAEGTKALAKGKFSGVANGDREHYRFTKSGSAYPDGAIVLIEMESGALRHFKIKDTGKRTER